MALNIKDPVTDQLARELARRMDTSITEALKVALEERLARTEPRMDVAWSDVQAVIERGRLRAVVDHRSADDIVGYDANGVPA